MAAGGDSKKHAAPGSGTPDWADRRRSVRFAVMIRVDYPSGGRTRFAYSSNLSTTGVYLRGDFAFEVGKRLALALTLKTEELPVRISAVVRNLRGGSSPGAGLEFLPGQELPLAAVRRFLEAEHVAKLEASLARSLSNGRNVALLAGYYVELGRAEEALDLYRRAVDANPTSLELREGLARLLVDRIRLDEDGARPAVEELEALVAGDAEHGSPTLDRLAAEAGALREAVEQREQERARREEEERERREREREERLRAEIGRGVREAADRELAARRLELERELAAKSAELAKERESWETALAVEREESAAALAREREMAEVALAEAERLRDQLGGVEAPPDPRIRELTERVASLEEERQDLLARVQEWRAAAAAAEQAASAREAEAAARLDQVEAEARALRARLGEREQELAARTQELEQGRSGAGEAGVLQAALDAATAEAGRLREEARVGAEERERLRAALTAAEGALEAERTRLRGDLELELRAALDAERGRLQGRAEALEQARVLAEAEAGRLEERARELALAERALAEGRQSIAAERAQLEERAGSVSAAEGALTEERRLVLAERIRLEKGAREARIAKKVLEDDRRALAQERTGLESDRRKVAQERTELEGDRRKVAQERTELETRARTLAEAEGRVAEERSALESRGRALDDRAQALADREIDVHRRTAGAAAPAEDDRAEVEVEVEIEADGEEPPPTEEEYAVVTEDDFERADVVTGPPTSGRKYR